VQVETFWLQLLYNSGSSLLTTCASSVARLSIHYGQRPARFEVLTAVSLRFQSPWMLHCALGYFLVFRRNVVPLSSGSSQELSRVRETFLGLFDPERDVFTILNKLLKKVKEKPLHCITFLRSVVADMLAEILPCH
jgi:hypothetical protein